VRNRLQIRNKPNLNFIFHHEINHSSLFQTEIIIAGCANQPDFDFHFGIGGNDRRFWH
jgi:hypothetical protein